MPEELVEPLPGHASPTSVAYDGIRQPNSRAKTNKPLHQTVARDEEVAKLSAALKQGGSNGSKHKRNFHSIRSVCAPDPGVRAFATWIDFQRRLVFVWGDGLNSFIMKKLIAADQLISGMTNRNNNNNKKRRILKEQLRKLKKNLNNLLDEVHRKLAFFLTNYYDLILWPEFLVSIRRGG